MGELLVEQVLSHTSEGKSPVSGESFPALSKDYKEKKIAQGGQGIPDLELTGSMKDEFTFKPTATGLEIGFWGDDAGKADGHLKFSGKDNGVPQRRFLPAEGQNFKKNIQKEIERIIADKSSELFSRSDFKGVKTSRDLYAVFREKLGGSSRSDIKMLVAGNPKLLDMLIDLGLEELI